MANSKKIHILLNLIHISKDRIKDKKAKTAQKI